MSDTYTLFTAIDALHTSLEDIGRIRYAKTFSALKSSLYAFLKGIDIALSDISTEHIKSYLTFLANNRLKPSTINFYFRAYRAFYTHYFPTLKKDGPFKGIVPDNFKPAPRQIITQRPEPVTDDTAHWFASKMFRYDVNKISQTVKRLSDDVYMPVIKDVKKVNHKIVERERSLCQLIFFKCNMKQIKEINEALRNHIMIYTTITKAGRQPSVIPDHEMRMFRIITSTGNEDLQYFTDNLAKFREGQRVRVIAGEFEGAEGTIVRIKKDRRLVVTITGICAVATPHLSPEILQNLY